MRSIQRGVSTLFLIAGILGITIAAASTYFIFAQNLDKKAKAINSFEDCAKLYPIMESYPEQCNTPDGKYFTRQLSVEEENRLVPPLDPSPSVKSGETANPDSIGANWKTYKDKISKFSLEYPPNLHESGDRTQMFLVKNTATPAEKLSYADQLVEIRVGNNVSRFNQYYDTSISQKVEGYGDFKIKNSLIDNNQAVEYGYDEAAEQRALQLNKEALESGKSVGSINFRKGLIINKQGTVIEISTNNYQGDFKQSFDKILTTIKFLE